MAVATCTVLGLGLGGAPATAADRPRDSLVQGPLKNPGVLDYNNTYYVYGTGPHNAIPVKKATKVAGPYTNDTVSLLQSRLPQWMNPNKALWAPSVIKSKKNDFTMFFAAEVKNFDGQRCIGTATSATPTGEFVPQERALACWHMKDPSDRTKDLTRPKDVLSREPNYFTAIDATASVVGDEYVLTYKTGARIGKGPWVTETRLLRLNPDAPSLLRGRPKTKDDQSIVITHRKENRIEENPVLVKQPGSAKYTLFTSVGGFKTGNYKTVYRQNKNLWAKGEWQHSQDTDLKFPADANTEGTGNAHIMQTREGWRIFFNGLPNRDGNRDDAPYMLYAGVLSWPGGMPKVTRMVK